LRRILRRALILRLRLDLAELGDAVDQPRDILPEQPLDLLRSGDRVLDRVVEDRGRDRLVVELQVGEDPGDFDRMAEIGVARRAELSSMRLHRKDVGAVDQPLIRVRIVGSYLFDELVLAKHAPKMVRRPPIVQARTGGAALPSLAAQPVFLRSHVL
jgi:hypothetical protein